MAEKKFNDFGASNGFGFDSFIADIQKQTTKPEEKKPAAEPVPEKKAETAKNRAGESPAKKTVSKAKEKKAAALPEEKPTAHTLSVRHSVWKEAKAKATQNDMTISELIEKYLEKYINS